MEISSFAKYRIAGEGARTWLDRVLACRVPRPGRMTLAPMLKEDGRLIGDFTLANLGEEGFLILGSGLGEDYHMRWFHQHLPEDGSVSLRAPGLGLVGLSVAGPKAREVLAALTRDDVSRTGMRFMDVRRMRLGMAPALVGRISFTGDLGYEIWCLPEYQRHLFEALMRAGEPHGIRLFGSRALNALRLEKGFGGWAREYRPLYSPVEAGLDPFVAFGKEADFIGKAAAKAERAQGGRLRLRTFVLEAKHADAIGDEPLWLDGEVVGWVTSGGYAHHSKASVALGYVPREVAERDSGWEVELLGERLPARLQRGPLFDHNGERMRN